MSLNLGNEHTFRSILKIFTPKGMDLLLGIRLKVLEHLNDTSLTQSDLNPICLYVNGQQNRSLTDFINGIPRLHY